MASGIDVDIWRCIGAASCVRHAPTVFTQDEEGVVELLPGAARQAGTPQVAEAVEACPVQAITLR